MIVSHRHRFVFIKTRKTAGTSVEVFLSPTCGERDIVTPLEPPEPGHRPRNFRGLFNPFTAAAQREPWLRTAKRLVTACRYYNHMPALLVRERVGAAVWDEYFTFCVERNPWDKVVSMWHMERGRTGRDLSLREYLAHGRRFPLNEPLYTDGSGAVIVDEVLRYERLDEGLARVFERVGVPFPGSLGIRTKAGYGRPKRSYREAFDDETRGMVARIFAREIALLGYEF